MTRITVTIIAALLCALFVSAATAASVSMKLSGPGKVNDTTIKAGQKVSLDLYLSNDTTHMGLSVGFKFSSPDGSIKTIVHPVDSTVKAVEGSKGDIIAFNGFEDRSRFDLLNQVVLSDWDGKLPDVMGFMMHVFKKRWDKMPETKAYSIQFVVPEAGMLKVDSCFFPPAGRWIATTEKAIVSDVPKWGGPYKFRVVK